MGSEEPNLGKTCIIFQLSESFSDLLLRFVLNKELIGVLLPVPTKAVIGSYLPSSQALPLRTEILVSHANIFTWDALLQSLLSRLPEWPFTSKSELRHQPKRCFTSVKPCRSRTDDTVSHIVFLFWLGPSHQQDDIHWVPMCL